MRDFFAFRTMITGFVVQIVFVLGLIIVVVGGIGAIANDQPVVGILVLALGGLYWRIICELMVVIFRIHGSANAIRMNTAGLLTAFPGTGGSPAPASAPSEPASTVAPAATLAVTEPTAALPAAGWYPDSERSGHKRWWDGAAWGKRDDEDTTTSVAETAVADEPQTAETAAKTFCANCGAERNPTSRFCTACGQA